MWVVNLQNRDGDRLRMFTQDREHCSFGGTNNLRIPWCIMESSFSLGERYGKIWKPNIAILDHFGIGSFIFGQTNTGVDDATVSKAASDRHGLLLLNVDPSLKRRWKLRAICGFQYMGVSENG